MYDDINGIPGSQKSVVAVHFVLQILLFYHYPLKTDNLINSDHKDSQKYYCLQQNFSPPPKSFKIK